MANGWRRSVVAETLPLIFGAKSAPPECNSLVTIIKIFTRIKINVSGSLYNGSIKQRTLMNEIETEIRSLMAEVEAEEINGSTDDENGDPRLFRIGNLLSLLQVVDWEAYKRLVLDKFNVPADYFD